MAYSLYIDPLYNDFRISNGDLVLIQGCDNVAQKIRTTLKTELGEWFLNINFGLPYYSVTPVINDNTTQGIFGGSISAAEIESYLLAATFQVPGVISINSFELKQVTTRQFLVDMAVQCEAFDNNGLGTQKEVNISLDLGA